MIEARPDRENLAGAPWCSGFVFARWATTSLAAALILSRQPGDQQRLLALLVLVYGIGSIVLVSRSPAFATRRPVWAVDAAVSLGLILAAAESRVPLCLLAVTAAILPASELRQRRAIPRTQPGSRGRDGSEPSRIDARTAERTAPTSPPDLTAALRNRAADIRAVTTARITISGHANDLPAHVAPDAYRIASDAMSNAVGHSHAGLVKVASGRGDHRLAVLISDDGRGAQFTGRCEPNPWRAMAAGVAAVGGRLHLASAEHRGTIVQLEMQLTADQQGAAR